MHKHQTAGLVLRPIHAETVMKTFNKITFLAAALLLAAPALADDTHHQNDDEVTQQQLTMMGGAMMGNAMMGRGGMNDGMMSMMMPMLQMLSPRHIEGRLAFLKTELKITGAQEAAWNTFADAFRGSVKESSDIMPDTAGMMQAKDASDLLQKMSGHEKALSEELARLQKLGAATKPLYLALSEDQKKTADELLMPALSGHM